MIKVLKKNSVDEKNSNINEIKNKDKKQNNRYFININNINNPIIPRLYQRKKVSYISKSINRNNSASIKKYEKCKIYKTNNIFKSTYYVNLKNKNNEIKYKYTNNKSTNKSNINTTNTTLNNTNNNTSLNCTNNNSLINIISKNLYKNNKNKKHMYIKRNISQIINDKNNNKNETDDDTNINDLNNEETEEKIPVHISNYNGLKGNNRDWGLSKTYSKGQNKSSKEKSKYNDNTYIHKNIDNNYKYKTLCADVKKKLYYDDKKKVSNIKEINVEKKNFKINIFTSPNINNWNRIKQLNFDQPFRYHKMSNSIENMKNKRINGIPKLKIDLTNFKFKKNNGLYINTISNEISERGIGKERIKLLSINSYDNKNINNPSLENSFNIFNKDVNKKENLSPNINNIKVKKNYFQNNKYSNIKIKTKSDRFYKNDKIICSYTIKRHKNTKNIYNYIKLIHQSNNNNDKNKRKTKNNLSDLIFSIKNIKFKHYIENFLDTKSLMILSSINKIYYKNFRYIIYNKYYDKIILDANKKENINQILKSLLKYSSIKLKNKSKEEISQIYKSFNYKSIYNEHIIKDLTRTFPNDTTFNKNSLGYYKLFNLLTVYSNFNKQIGYAQGLNFLSAIGLSLFDTEQEAFVFLDGLLNRFDLVKYMGINNNNLVQNLKYFSNILNKYVSEIISFFESKLVNHEFFSTNWILTLFSNCMNRNCLIIIWCFMIIFGWKFFYCFTIESLNIFKDDIIITEEKELNFKMKNLLSNDKFEKNMNRIIECTFQLMKNCISL